MITMFFPGTALGPVVGGVCVCAADAAVTSDCTFWLKAARDEPPLPLEAAALVADPPEELLVEELLLPQAAIDRLTATVAVNAKSLRLRSTDSPPLAQRSVTVRSHSRRCSPI
jgi:hypothetical protein